MTNPCPNVEPIRSRKLFMKAANAKFLLVLKDEGNIKHHRVFPRHLLYDVGEETIVLVQMSTEWRYSPRIWAHDVMFDAHK